MIQQQSRFAISTGCMLILMAIVAGNAFIQHSRLLPGVEMRGALNTIYQLVLPQTALQHKIAGSGYLPGLDQHSSGGMLFYLK